MKKKIYNINFKKILTIIIIFGITLNVTKVFARTLGNQETIVEEKSYYNGTINDDFSDDKIIIVLSKEETNKYKDYTTEDFPEINCKSVIDLTASSSEILKNKDSKNNEKILINREKFNRILCLELNEKSKEEVLLGIKKLERREEILSAEPNFTFQLTSVPNDEKISEQWGLVNANAYNSWDISQNANQVIVGVVDTGIDASHSDLTNNIYRLQEHNLNTTLHRDFTTGMESGTAILEPTDPKGHGTHVAGIIGAQGNNNIGVAGICWNIKLVSLKVADSNGAMDIKNVVKAIHYAGSKAIPILNCSFGSDHDLSSMRKAIESYDGLLVCAAGNSGYDIDSTKIYPASYDNDNIIAVGAIDSNNNRAKWKNSSNIWGLLGNDESNYGEKSVDIYAPGANILSTYLNNSYKEDDGTSMAAPFVTGAAALLLASNSYLTTEELKNAIINGAEQITITVPGKGCNGVENQNVLKLNIYNSIRLVAFKTNQTGETITGTWFNEKNDIKIPTIINGITITNIGDSAFENHRNLQNLILPGQLITIGNSAFKQCENLTMINIPNTVGRINSNAFKNCTSLQNIVLSHNLSSIGDSAFENCQSLQNINLPNYLTSIGDSVFKGCTNLANINIPNYVTDIGNSVFENCQNLQNITLPNYLTDIGNSAFKGCTNLASINIPNSITSINSNTFENCISLKSVLLHDNITSIGASAFKGCTSLESISLPSKINNIGDEAFRNCSSLSSVTVNREISNTTNLGENAFDGCHTNLQIIVPTNRIAEYKNKEYWSSYRNKIIPSEDYTEYEIDCEGSLNYTLTLNSKYNKLYKLNVDCSKSYKINANSLNNVDIIIYDSNMNVVSSDSNTITQFLGCGTYYISFEFNNINDSGIIEISITLTWLSTNIPLSSGINNIKNSMHLNSGNIYHCSYEYLHNQGEGFYRFSLNFGNNRILPEGAIKIYSDRNRTTLLSRYTISGINKQAVNDNGENEIYLYLPGNSYYYIDIVLPKSTYTLITLTIEEIENKDINYLNRLDSSGFDVIFEDKTSTSYFEKVTISHRSKIELDIVTSGTINRNIPICIFEIQEAPGSRPGDEYSYIVSRLTDSITSINRSPIFTIILNPGTYYIGYSDNLDNASISFSLRRKVNIDLNINGTLATDPALNQGFPLGSEVTFNDGALLGNTITEGFTRNLYLMVEDRLRDPMSRLEYDWYSSNENVAIVTKYGTVLALNVNENTTVTIYAINKDNPSIVYKKDFVILKETKTEQIVIECNMSYSYSEENGMYTLELDFTNSPYPYIGYYVWDIESFNGISVDMEHYGLIYSTGPGEALLTANYILNMRIFLKIHLTITE